MVASSPAGACWPFLAWLAGRLIPAIGAGQLERVLPTVAAALGVFAEA
jgi:ATP-binding cassette subfamily B protein